MKKPKGLKVQLSQVIIEKKYCIEK